MPESPIASVSINSLRIPSNYDGAFVTLKLSEYLVLLKSYPAFKGRFYTLLVVESGEGSLSVDNHPADIKSNRVFFINYNQVVQLSLTGEALGKAILFTRSFYNLIYTGNLKIKNDTAFSSLSFYTDFKPKDFKQLQMCVSNISSEFAADQPLNREIICLLLKTLMLKYIRSNGTVNYVDFKTNRKQTYVEDFKKLVNKNFRDLKRTSDYAPLLHISPNYLNAVVKEKLDLSAERVIQNRVILEAERLLLNTDLSVTEISYELGFSDKSHFGKYFKKIIGDTPNNYRKKFCSTTTKPNVQP